MTGSIDSIFLAREQLLVRKGEAYLMITLCHVTITERVFPVFNDAMQLS